MDCVAFLNLQPIDQIYFISGTAAAAGTHSTKSGEK